MATTNQTVQSYYQTILDRTASANEVAFWANQVDQAGIPLTQVETAFVTSPEAQTWVTPIVGLYEAYLGRAPDAVGLSNWVHAFEGGMTLAAVSAAFAASPENSALYGSSATVDAAFVTKLYQTTLNRAPESTTIVANWVASGMTKAAMEAAFLASGEAQSALGKAASSFLTAVGNGVIAAYGSAGGPSLFSIGSVGSTFVLTPGVDAGTPFTGGASNDTFIGTIGPAATPSTLTAGDSLDGAGGTNTLKIIDTLGNGVNVLAGVTLANMQIVSDQNAIGGASSADFTLYPAVSQVIALNTAGGGVDTFTGLATGAQVIASGLGTGAGPGGPASTVVFSMKTATDAVSVGVDGGVNGVTFTDTAVGAPTAATISSTGAANGSTKLGLSDTFNLTTAPVSIKTLAVNAASNLVATLTAGNYAAGPALTVSGAAANVTLLGAGLDFKTIDASGLTGGGLTASSGASLTSFKGGGGVDTLTLAAKPTTASINLGDGNDALIGTTPTPTTVTADGGAGTDAVSSALINAGNGANFLNFELLDLGANTLDTSLLTGSTLTGLVLSGAGGGTFQNVATGAGLSVTSTTAVGTTTINVKGAPANATDSFTVTFNGKAVTGAAPVAPNVKAGTLALPDVETINIASGGGTNTWNSVNIVDDAAKAITITGSQNLNLIVAQTPVAPATTGSLATIDGTAATGNLAVATGGAFNGSLTGGTSDDTLTVVSAAKLTGGVGKDTFDGMKFTNSATSFAEITDFTVGSDKLVVPGAADTFTATKIDVGAAQTFAGALDLAAVGGAGRLDWFQFGSNTYAVEDNSAAAVFSGAADHVIKLDGLLDLSALTQSTPGVFA